MKNLGRVLGILGGIVSLILGVGFITGIFVGDIKVIQKTALFLLIITPITGYIIWSLEKID
jgi:multisubunit Na+/H+ antiporter MnhG subunit